MLDNKIPAAANKQSGFSLVELMVAVVLGLLITAAVTAMTVSSLKMSGNTLKSARLNQDLGAVMQIMVNDIRRTAYSYCDKVANDSPDCPDDPKTGEEGNHVFYGDDGEDIDIGDNPDNTTPPSDGDCILYSYNQDADPNKDDYFGFRRDEVDVVGVANKVGVVQMADNTGAVACNADDNWVSMTDPEIIDVTSLEFNSDGSKCHNIDDVKSIRITPGVSDTEFACNKIYTDENKDKFQQGSVDTEKGSWEWSSELTLDFHRNIKNKSLKEVGVNNPGYVLPITSVGVRHVNISLEADLTRDSSISKNLDVSIKVRNDHVYHMP